MGVFKFRNLDSGQAMPIPVGEFTIGRADDTYVHLEDGSVSRSHAIIYNLDNGYFIEDNGSANGTVVQGAYISGRTRIEYGDIVHIGMVPFRVDPEVAGELGAKPSAGLRVSKRDYMRRDTERLPPLAEAPRTVPALSVEQLSAPQISVAADLDAEEINAIALREPEPSARLPIVRPGVRGTPESPVPQPLPVPTPQSHAQSSPLPELKIPRPTPVAHAATSLTAPAPKSEPTPVHSVQLPTWGWLMMFFLAGMGIGILQGLFFAWLFFQLGGKAGVSP